MEPGLSRSMYFRFTKRMMVFWWLMMPFAFFAPGWNAVHSRPDEHGAWIGFAFLGVPVLVVWIYAFKTGRLLWQLMDVWTQEDIAAARERKLKDRLTVIRAERLERAEARLARIHESQREAEAAAMAADLIELSEELDDDVSFGHDRT